MPNTNKTDDVDASGKALVDHWKWAADKGLMNPNSAAAVRAACKQVLGVVDDWETRDTRALDLDDVLRRFQNKRSRDFKPESLETYKRRFTYGLRSFLEFIGDPASWNPGIQERNSSRRERKPAEAADTAEVAVGRLASVQPVTAGLVEYPFPLREGRFAYLRLPMDLSAADVKRLTAYLTTLVFDEDS